MPHFLFQDESIPYTEGQTVLEALLCAGKAVSFACKQGVCQSCILKSLAGNIPEKSNQDLKATQKEEGLFLSCITPAQSDLVLATTDTQGSYLGKIKAVNKLNDSVMQVLLELENAFDYRAGQYITVTNDDGVSRCYSLASQPQDQLLELHISHYPDGQFSNWLFEKTENILGQALKIQGPIGHCYYTQTDKDLVCIAYGTGLAPIYGLIKDALSRHYQGQITLYYGASHSDHFYFLDEISELSQNHPNFSYTLIEASSDPLTFSNEVLQKIDKYDNTRYFLCGSKATVQTLRKKLYLNGVSLDEIFADAFFSWGLEAS